MFGTDLTFIIDSIIGKFIYVLSYLFITLDSKNIKLYFTIHNSW